MATVSPSVTDAVPFPVVTWAGMATGDTITGYPAPAGNGAAFGCVQFYGTFGGATVTLEGSNDGTNWATLTGTDGSAISTSAAGIFEFSTAALFIRPGAPTSGTGDAITAVVVLRD